MRVFLVLCVAVTAVLAESPFVGYHDRVGIPLAARIKEAELAAIQGGSRIIGGRPAPLGEHPYLVGLVTHFGQGLNSVCGSTMLSNTRAITAAHCWFDTWRQTDMFTLVFGSEYIFFGGVRVNSTDVVTHPGWNGAASTIQDDVAIIRFQHVPYTNFIRPVSLPSGDLVSNQFVGFWAQASGYGLTAEGAGLPANQVQHHVSLQVITNEVCSRSFPTSITEKIICTSGVGFFGPVGICSSDSGGPLSILHIGQRILIGVISFGTGRCEGGGPDGYVRVTAHLPWIQAQL